MLGIRDYIDEVNSGLPVYKPVKVGRFMDRVILELTPVEFKQLIHNVDGGSVVIVTKKSSRFSSDVVYKYILLLNGVLVYCKTDKELELPENSIIFIVDKFDYPRFNMF